MEQQNDKIHDFGVPIITREEQKKCLIIAADIARFDNSLHEESHRKYERDPQSGRPSGINSKNIRDFKSGRPFGYCKSTACKQRQNRTAVWAAQFGIEVGYNCVDCLATFIHSARASLKGTNISVVFLSDVEKQEEVKQAEFVVEFTEDGVIINNDLGPFEFKFSNPIEGEALISVYGIFKGVIPGKSYAGIIRGRHVCENIILGKKCLSMESTYDPITFLSQSVPRGVPGWKELKDNLDFRKRGKIMVYKFCPACALSYNNKQNNWSVIKPSDILHSKQDEYWKMKYSDVQRENAELRIQIAELQALLKNAQIKN